MNSLQLMDLSAIQWSCHKLIHSYSLKQDPVTQDQNFAISHHKHMSYLFRMLSWSLVSSLCLSRASFRATTCFFKLSVSALCFSASRRHSISNLDHCLLPPSYLRLRKQHYRCSINQSKRHRSILFT